MKTKTAGIRKAASLLLSHDNIAIFTHLRPDFDTIGSGYALAHALRKAGKRVCVCCSDELADRYMLIADRKKLEPEFEPDYVVCVDMASYTMLGRFADKYASRVGLSIDHHEAAVRFAEYTFERPGCAAVGEMIFDLYKTMHIELDDLSAKYLYCAISSDSGCFKYGNTTPGTHLRAAELLKYNIGASFLNRVMFDCMTEKQMRIHATAYSSVRMFADGKVALLTFTRQMIESIGAEQSDLEMLSQLPRCVFGAEVGIVLKETAPNTWKGSVRSNDRVDAAKLCSGFGGGGHFGAGGFVSIGSAREIEEQIVAAAAEAVSHLD